MLFDAPTTWVQDNLICLELPVQKRQSARLLVRIKAPSLVSNEKTFSPDLRYSLFPLISWVGWAGRAKILGPEGQARFGLEKFAW